MTLGIARKAVEDDIAIDLAIGGIGRCKGSQHRSVDGRCAVCPG